MEMPITKHVTLLTVNWRRLQETLSCLETIADQSYSNLHVLVVDNASGDGSPELIQQRFPSVEVLVTSKNLGFAGGYNTGLRYALDHGSDFIFIVNNDTLLAPDCIEQLLNQWTPGDGILAPLIYYASEPDRIWKLGGQTNPWNLESEDFWAGKSDPGAWPANIEMDFVTGCAMLFPRAALEQVGIFDEAFQLYYEDSDLCLRMRRAGWHIRVAPSAHLWHKVATSSGGSDSPKERYWMARSSLRFFRKHATKQQIPVIAAWRLASAFRTSLRLASRKNWVAVLAYWRGLVDGFFEEQKGPGGEEP